MTLYGLKGPPYVGRSNIAVPSIYKEVHASGGILGGSGLSHDLDDDRGQEIDKIELINIVKLLGSKLEDLQTCHDLIVKHGLALQRSLGK